VNAPAPLSEPCRDVLASDVDVMLVEHLSRIANATEGMARKAYKDGYVAGKRAAAAVYDEIEREHRGHRGRELARAMVVLALVVFMLEALARLTYRAEAAAE